MFRFCARYKALHDPVFVCACEGGGGGEEKGEEEEEEEGEGLVLSYISSSSFFPSLFPLPVLPKGDILSRISPALLLSIYSASFSVSLLSPRCSVSVCVPGGAPCVDLFLRFVFLEKFALFYLVLEFQDVSFSGLCRRLLRTGAAPSIPVLVICVESSGVPAGGGGVLGVLCSRTVIAEVRVWAAKFPPTPRPRWSVDAVGSPYRHQVGTSPGRPVPGELPHGRREVVAATLPSVSGVHGRVVCSISAHLEI
ncbi:hypothetical protein E2C01_032189 [Portunus trituberculatus]|uniref:Uncharacterized protein n=1 Tax=Portunus trituberculatus TaxID=210409 RepID=A0A5B7F0A3_PORTR|nr:hypothetical protein [Portunus trituberculatus]